MNKNKSRWRGLRPASRAALALAAAALSFGTANAVDSMPSVTAPDLAVSAVVSAAAPVPNLPASTQRRGTLYRVRDHGNTAWLFGTVHAGKAAWYPLEPTVTEAFDSAGRLVVELDARNTQAIQAAFVQRGVYPAGDTLDQHVSAATLAAARRVAQRYDIPWTSMSTLRPWAVTLLISGLMLEKAGFQSALGADQYFLSRATRLAKPVEELESVDLQLGMFDVLSASEQEKLLAELLKGIEDGSGLEMAITTVTGWSRADEAAVLRVMRHELAGSSVTALWMRRVVLGKRNHEMAARVATLLRGEPSLFVAVGMLHLLGNDGVPALLRRRGIEVTKIY
jgi:uncharacterized protein YbaP (TraB family)